MSASEEEAVIRLLAIDLPKEGLQGVDLAVAGVVVGRAW